MRRAARPRCVLAVLVTLIVGALTLGACSGSGSGASATRWSSLLAQDTAVQQTLAALRPAGSRPPGAPQLAGAIVAAMAPRLAVLADPTAAGYQRRFGTSAAVGAQRLGALSVAVATVLDDPDAQSAADRRSGIGFVLQLSGLLNDAQLRTTLARASGASVAQRKLVAVQDAARAGHETVAATTLQGLAKPLSGEQLWQGYVATLSLRLAGGGGNWLGAFLGAYTATS